VSERALKVWYYIMWGSPKQDKEKF